MNMSENTEPARSLKDGSQFTGPISDEFYKLFNSPETVSAILARDPSISPGDAWDTLYKHHDGKKLSGPHSIHRAGKHTPSEGELQKAAACGRWGSTQPSELFLTVSEHSRDQNIISIETNRNRCTMMRSTRLRKTHRTPS